MAEISDSALIGALRRQMTIAVAKQVTAASNLANVDTPGFRAREVHEDQFEDALQLRLSAASTVAVTNGRHLSNGSPSAVAVDETRGLQARRDGNNVQLDRELLAMTRASSEFTTAQTALAAKFRLVRYAISEGR